MTTVSLLELFTSPLGFGISEPGPVQQAICHIADGQPLPHELAANPEVIAAIGDVSLLPPCAPKEIDVLAGIRSGKSRLAACLAVRASQTVEVAHLKPGEVPRVSIVSLTKDLADVVLDHLVGTLQASPLLSRLLIEPPVGDSVLVRHPSGRPIEIKVVAGARAGASLVARWSAGCIFDEFTRMVGSYDGGVINFDDCRRAVIGRLLSGAQIISIGSPWAPMGPAYERCTQSFGKPSPELVVIRATAPSMNPIYWTPERCDALRRSDEQAWLTDVCCEFADPSTSFLAQSVVRAATRPDPELELPPRKGRGVHFSMDPASRGNGWTLVGVAYFADADGVTRFEVVLCKQWIGSTLAPLSPARVLKEIAQVMAPYNARHVFTDQHAGDFIVDIGERVGLRVIVRTVSPGNSPEASTGVKPTPGRVFKNDLFETLKGAFSSGVITIPNDRVLVNDLLSIRRRLTATGIAYDLPVTADGRHCDYVPALALALSEFPAVASLRVQLARAERDRRYEFIGAILAGTAPVGKAEEYFALANGTTTIDQLRTPTGVRMAEGQQRWRDGDGAYRTALDWNHLLRRTGSPIAVSDEALDAKFGRGPTSVPNGET